MEHALDRGGRSDTLVRSARAQYNSKQDKGTLLLRKEFTHMLKNVYCILKRVDTMFFDEILVHITKEKYNNG